MTNTALYFGPGDYVEVKGGKARGVRRLANMHRDILRELKKRRPLIAVIEGYAFMAQARQHRLGEIGGVIRLACAQAGVMFIYELPPTSLKKHFTGSGASDKEEMLDEAIRRHGEKLPSHDVADACALWHAGADIPFLAAKAEVESLGG